MTEPARVVILLTAPALLCGLLAAAQSPPTFAPQVIDAELAGRALLSYPRFEFVRTFHEGDTVNVAIDPSAHPDIIGVTADVYISPNRDLAQWAANPTLVDVRGVPDVVTFGAGGITSCIFPLASATLGGNAGANFGVPYDLVVDTDRNGQLGAGDYIDGRSGVGFYVVRDPTLLGSLAVTEVLYSGGTWLGQDTYYPTNIASMGQLPLVVVSHGNGHNYTWYDHIGFHLASYGCVVMSHQNDTGPGIETASTTTLTNTEYILANQATIAGGVLNGHIDSHHIVFIGHSRGGEGVVRAYNRVYTGQFVPTQFTVTDIKLVSSIAPVTFLSSTQSNPQEVDFHLLYGAADADVTGAPTSTGSKPFAIYERARGNKFCMYIQGAGHADFHSGGGSCVCTGPNLIGSAATHLVQLGYYVPLVKFSLEDNEAARDYLTRMYGSFHPPGIPSNVILSSEYHLALSAPNFSIDDFQSNASTALSSSGGLVTFDVQNVVEGVMTDIDSSFFFTPAVPHNGMTNQFDAGDNAHCVVFDWSLGQNYFYELELVPSHRDLRRDTWLSFRAAQGTRHPETDGLDAPLTFTVTLRDGNGVTSSIPIAGYGAFTRTYPRTGSGIGAGWANEFSSVRLRLSDFQSDGVAPNLGDIVAVRFEFGGAFGSPRGRIGLDDIELIKN